ncbi:hypothetical protein RIF29_16682 [Crotalaria pallida]|uniref:Uncharacterized protein n=1 Tax=Crotalaria pallida TaxID=3830 RepID=A0AAN9FMW7_CROPI
MPYHNTITFHLFLLTLYFTVFCFSFFIFYISTPAITQIPPGLNRQFWRSLFLFHIHTKQKHTPKKKKQHPQPKQKPSSSPLFSLLIISSFIITTVTPLSHFLFFFQ